MFIARFVDVFLFFNVTFVGLNDKDSVLGVMQPEDAIDGQSEFLRGNHLTVALSVTYFMDVFQFIIRQEGSIGSDMRIGVG